MAAAVVDLLSVKYLTRNVRRVGLDEFRTEQSIDEHDHRIAHTEWCARSRDVEI